MSLIKCNGNEWRILLHGIPHRTKCRWTKTLRNFSEMVLGYSLVLCRFFCSLIYVIFLIFNEKYSYLFKASQFSNCLSSKCRTLISVSFSCLHIKIDIMRNKIPSIFLKFASWVKKTQGFIGVSKVRLVNPILCVFSIIILKHKGY